MNPSQPEPIQPGGLWRVHWSLYRILDFDGSEALMDARSLGPDGSDGGEWIMGDSPRKSASFYRMSGEALRKDGRMAGVAPLTPDEMDKWHPGLPFRGFRTRAIAWGDSDSVAAAVELMRCAKSGARLQLGPTYRADHVMVYPLKATQTIHSRPVKVARGKDGEILLADFVAALAGVQSGFWKKRRSDGIGLYRSGHCHGAASYYAGEFHDLAGLIAAGRIKNPEASEVR